MKIKEVLVLIMFINLFLIGISKVSATNEWVDNINSCGGNSPCFSTIQAAIDAANPGDTIIVYPATYKENITVNKSLTLNGAQAGVDARIRPGPESIISSIHPEGAIRINATGIVTIDGFYIISSPIPNGGGSIYVNGLTDNVIVRNDVFDQSSADAILLYLAKQGTIEQNYIKGAALSGITGGQSDSLPYLASQLIIRNNKIENAKYGISGYLNNAQIYSNSITGNSSLVMGAGIGGQFYNSVILNNTVSGYSAGAGIGFANSPSLNRQDSSNLTILYNTFSGNEAGVYVDPTESLVGKNINITLNDIFGNTPYGAINYGTGILNAIKNWWGDSSGPYNASTNPSGAGNSVDGNVNYNPWLCVNFSLYQGIKETTCNDGKDNDCDFNTDCQDTDCVNATGPGGKECCSIVSDCPGNDNSCKRCTSNECNPWPILSLCDVSYLCSNSIGGDNTYGMSDFKSPRQGYCDGQGSCDYTLSSGPNCTLAKTPNQEGTGLNFCQDGVPWCRDTCADTVDNDGDGLTDSADPDCGLLGPASVINSPAVGSWHNKDFPVNVSDSGALAYCQYRVWSYNGTDWINTRVWTNRTCNNSTSMIITVGYDKDCRDQGNNTCEIHVKAIDDSNNEGVTVMRKFSIDWLGPNIGSLIPKNNSCINDPRPMISANYYDLLTGVNQSSVRIIVDGVDVTLSATITHSKVSYTPTSNLPEGINNVIVIANDTLGNSANKSWSFIIDTIKPVVIINSPVNSTIYSEKMVDMNISVIDKNPIKLEYSYNGILFNPLCNLCNSYNKKMSFKDGSNILYIRAKDCAGNTGLAQVHFYVDTKPPKIVKQYPTCKTCMQPLYGCNPNTCTNGTFVVYYTEDDLKNISLYYKGVFDSDYKVVTNTNCPSGTNQGCNFFVNLTGYEGMIVQYYFVVRDYGRETKSNGCNAIVDDITPNITVISPKSMTYNSSKVLFYINVSQPVLLEYSDNGCKFIKLCSNCDSFNRMITLSNGIHQLQIRATDCSGNSAIVNRVITINKKFWCFFDC